MNLAAESPWECSFSEREREREGGREGERKRESEKKDKGELQSRFSR